MTLFSLFRANRQDSASLPVNDGKQDMQHMYMSHALVQPGQRHDAMTQTVLKAEAERLDLAAKQGVQSMQKGPAVEASRRENTLGNPFEEEKALRGVQKMAFKTEQQDFSQLDNLFDKGEDERAMNREQVRGHIQPAPTPQQYEDMAISAEELEGVSSEESGNFSIVLHEMGFLPQLKLPDNEPGASSPQVVSKKWDDGQDDPFNIREEVFEMFHQDGLPENPTSDQERVSDTSEQGFVFGDPFEGPLPDVFQHDEDLRRSVLQQVKSQPQAHTPTDASHAKKQEKPSKRRPRTKKEPRHDA